MSTPQGNAAPDPARGFASIEVLRGIAASMVVVCHAGLALPATAAGDQVLAAIGPVLAAMRSGVDVFFIVSGFVMMAQISRPTPPTWQVFLARRAIRIYPAYWLATAMLLPGTWLHIGVGVGSEYDLQAILLSLALVPQALEPVLMQAWTLIHELVFYLIVAAILAVGLARHAIGVMAGLTALAFAQATLGGALGHGVLFSPHLAEFLAGMVLYRVRRHLPRRTAPALAAAAVAGLAAVTLAGPFDATATPETGLRVALFGGPALLAVAAAVGLEGMAAPRWLADLGHWLGRTSYSLYLFHTLPLAGCGWVLAGRDLAPAALGLIVVGAVGFAVLWGGLIGATVEVPLHAWLLRRCGLGAPAGQRRPNSRSISPSFSST